MFQAGTSSQHMTFGLPIPTFITYITLFHTISHTHPSPISLEVHLSRMCCFGDYFSISTRSTPPSDASQCMDLQFVDILVIEKIQDSSVTNTKHRTSSCSHSAIQFCQISPLFFFCDLGFDFQHVSQVPVQQFKLRPLIGAKFIILDQICSIHLHWQVQDVAISQWNLSLR